MVFVKRMLNHRFNGHCSSVVPRAPRSIRKPSLRDKKVEGTQLCAFELLATVAGKLLEESECSSTSEGSVYFSGNQKGICEEKLVPVNGDRVSPVVSSASSEKVQSDSKMSSQRTNDDIVELSSKITRDFPLNVLDNVVNQPPASTNAKEIVVNDSFLEHVNDVKTVRKDYDEILFRCTKPNNLRKKPPARSGDRRFRKLLTSEYWKNAPKLEDCEPANAGGVVKRPCYEIDGFQRDTPFKKRMLFDRSSVVTNDGGVSCESVSNSPEKSRDDNNSTAAADDEKLSSAFRSENSCDSGNTPVRLSIKSFKVPELFVEVPENTTVDSLKRTVLEAVTSILSGGLRVGVMLHGKKIRDDNRTLLQAGISQNDDTSTVGFMFEPNNPTQPSTAPSLMEPPATPLNDSPKFANSPQIDIPKDIFLLNSPDKPYATDLKSPTRRSVELPEKTVADSEALALAVLPMQQRPKRCELGQRRTRRPFSVSEVEALVHAVEKLGTGRWRDIKLSSFDSAMHRTYVDLKDKWKTLVHTASISPQQRRGEPVPQELLDRVLAAQAYWSEHQTKPLDKPLQQCIIPKLNDSTV